MSTSPAVSHKFFGGPQPAGEYSFFQIAWIVPDVVAACRKWVEVFGAGPFSVMPKRTGVVRYRGREVALEMQLAVAQMGPVQIELIQQTNDVESVYRDIFPDAGKGGFHHMCTFSSDYDATVRHYESLGYPLVAETTGALRVGYFDTHADFGFITEVVSQDDGFLKVLTDLAQVAAEWDGKTDPIRLLRRGGYDVPA
ncbi:MAG: VOC family protein [Sphingobium sp.]